MAMQLWYEERVGRWAGADDAKKCSPSREMVGNAGFIQGGKASGEKHYFKPSRQGFVCARGNKYRRYTMAEAYHLVLDDIKASDYGDGGLVER